MKASNMIPSNPINCANGSKKLDECINIEVPLICIFAKSHITNPAGMATTTALPNTNKVLSKIDRIKIFPNCGFLYGGSSSVNVEGIPFKMVLDNTLEIIKVIATPKIMTNKTVIVAIKELPKTNTYSTYNAAKM